MQKFLIIPLVVLLILSVGYSQKETSSSLSDEEILTHLKSLYNVADKKFDSNALKALENNWEDGMIAPLTEIMRFGNSTIQAYKINDFLRDKKGEENYGFFDWMKWTWDNKPPVEPYYFELKAYVHEHIDDKFPKYFEGRSEQASIRLEEVVWGGVKQDGIPPLRNPKLLNANEADYLADSDVVFGAYINGVAKAYPKRILAWHEMFIDNFGDDLICGVYCTLCGTVIAYDTKHNGTTYHLGTSGFLYRSNKLMYDNATQSLWNTIEGKPVIGPLVDKGIELSSHSVVTTTWGEWKQLHPNTTVLSLDTGHRRDYGEGVAYHNYFATDQLMFNVPKLDKRLLNKDEVLIVRAEGYQNDPLAIAAKYLKKHPIYADKIGDTAFVVFTDKSGANRVYQTNGQIFDKKKGNTIIDNLGTKWELTEEQLIAENGQVLKRLPYHRIFWFAWFNTYENTRLVGGRKK